MEHPKLSIDSKPMTAGAGPSLGHGSSLGTGLGTPADRLNVTGKNIQIKKLKRPKSSITSQRRVSANATAARHRNHDLDFASLPTTYR